MAAQNRGVLSQNRLYVGTTPSQGVRLEVVDERLRYVSSSVAASKTTRAQQNVALHHAVVGRIIDRDLSIPTALVTANSLPTVITLDDNDTTTGGASVLRTDIPGQGRLFRDVLRDVVLGETGASSGRVVFTAQANMNENLVFRVARTPGDKIVETTNRYPSYLSNITVGNTGLAADRRYRVMYAAAKDVGPIVTPEEQAIGVVDSVALKESTPLAASTSFAVVRDIEPIYTFFYNGSTFTHGENANHPLTVSDDPDWVEPEAAHTRYRVFGTQGGYVIEYYGSNGSWTVTQEFERVNLGDRLFSVTKQGNHTGVLVHLPSDVSSHVNETMVEFWPNTITTGATVAMANSAVEQAHSIPFNRPVRLTREAGVLGIEYYGTDGTWYMAGFSKSASSVNLANLTLSFTSNLGTDSRKDVFHLVEADTRVLEDVGGAPSSTTATLAFTASEFDVTLASDWSSRITDGAYVFQFYYTSPGTQSNVFSLEHMEPATNAWKRLTDEMGNPVYLSAADDAGNHSFSGYDVSWETAAGYQDNLSTFLPAFLFRVYVPSIFTLRAEEFDYRNTRLYAEAGRHVGHYLQNRVYAATELGDVRYGFAAAAGPLAAGESLAMLRWEPVSRSSSMAGNEAPEARLGVRTVLDASGAATEATFQLPETSLAGYGNTSDTIEQGGLVFGTSRHPILNPDKDPDAASGIKYIYGIGPYYTALRDNALIGAMRRVPVRPRGGNELSSFLADQRMDRLYYYVDGNERKCVGDVTVFSELDLKRYMLAISHVEPDGSVAPTPYTGGMDGLLALSSNSMVVICAGASKSGFYTGEEQFAFRIVQVFPNPSNVTQLAFDLVPLGNKGYERLLTAEIQYEVFAWNTLSISS